MSPLKKIQAIYRHHSDFILLLILFGTFRVLALAAFRPGGLVLDFSDFYWYRGFAELTRQGYYPYDTLWTTYPPLFPAVMIAIYQFSALLPPWEFPNLWFSLLLGGFFLLFEIGNFILLYLLVLQLLPTEPARESGGKARPRQSTPQADNGIKNPQIPVAGHHDRVTNSQLRPCWIYATLFIPVYTLTGWFESYPLFFFLLSLYLLLRKRPYLSAFCTGIGFMIKLIPLILIPVAIQLISRIKYRLEINSGKLEITRSPAATTGRFSLVIPFDLSPTLVYLAIFLVTVFIIAAPFYFLNPNLILGPQQITAARQPWETIWALIDGNYDYGIIPLDMRDLTWRPGQAPATRIPWLLVTAGFGLIFAIFYTRPLNWKKPLNAVAFVGFTLCLFMLWSKGYSPQWLSWPLFFIALLLPNLRGITYAVILSIANIIEGNFYFIIFPEDRWLLVATVLIRTFILTVLAAEFLLLIWPQRQTPQLAKIRAWGVAIFVVVLLLASLPASLLLGRSYFELRQRQSPYAATITRLQGEQVTGALLLNNHTTYDWFYPYLRHNYTFFMLDDYASPGASVVDRTSAMLNQIATQTNVIWIFDADATVTTPAEEALHAWLDDRPPAHSQEIDGGRLYLFILD